MTTNPTMDIAVDRLSRSYGEVRAVDEVSFSIPPGQMTGFVGGNGAGKTTTMRMIMGVLQPSGGQVLCNGAPITTAQRRTIGYMPEERGLFPKQKILDQLIYLARLRGIKPQAAQASAMEYLERFGLADRTGEDLEKLSLGNQQRVQIVASLMGNPSALVLDEPFSGLDPDSVDDMAGMLREHTDRGASVLFSSHQLDLVERLCDQLVILRKGQVRANGSVEELRNAAPPRWSLVTRGDAAWVSGALTGALTVQSTSDNRVVLGTKTTAAAVQSDLDALLAKAMKQSGVVEFAPIRPTVTEIYRELTA